MTEASLKVKDQVIVAPENFQEIIDALLDNGYQVKGPTVEDESIVYDDVSSTDDLPVGLTDEQEGATFRLKKRKDNALFGFVHGQHSWKQFLHPPNLRIWHAKRKGKGFSIAKSEEEPPKFAFLGVRPCELAAIAIHDTVFTSEDYVDTSYLERRDRAFILAVNCSVAGGTCFCVSMKTGPKATRGFDLALTEVVDSSKHYLVFEVGSEMGAEILDRVPYKKAGEKELQAAEQVVQDTAGSMGRTMETDDVKELVYRNDEHPQWRDVAERCLTCGNCTMVCPTCFCVTIEDSTDLTGKTAERWRMWDSCFTLSFSYIHGGSVRKSPEARYRQWLTHKLASWQDQFGTMGCVGCGRCITWCPVGIDITEEVRAIRENERTPGKASSHKEE